MTEEEFVSETPVPCAVRCRFCQACDVFYVHRVSEAVALAKAKNWHSYEVEKAGVVFACDTCHAFLRMIAREGK